MPLNIACSRVVICKMESWLYCISSNPNWFPLLSMWYSLAYSKFYLRIFFWSRILFSPHAPAAAGRPALSLWEFMLYLFVVEFMNVTIYLGESIYWSLFATVTRKLEQKRQSHELIKLLLFNVLCQIANEWFSSSGMVQINPHFSFHLFFLYSVFMIINMFGYYSTLRWWGACIFCFIGSATFTIRCPKTIESRLNDLLITYDIFLSSFNF